MSLAIICFLFLGNGLQMFAYKSILKLLLFFISMGFSSALNMYFLRIRKELNHKKHILLIQELIKKTQLKPVEMTESIYSWKSHVVSYQKYVTC